MGIDLQKELNEYDKIQQKLNEITKLQKELSNKRYDKQELFKKYIYDNKLYIPIEKLSDFNNLNVDKITLITDKGKYKDFWKDELMGVKDNRFYYSSYEGGLYEYNSKDGLYHSHYHYATNDGDNIVGFVDLKLDTCWLSDEKKSKLPDTEYTKMENILKKTICSKSQK